MAVLQAVRRNQRLEIGLSLRAAVDYLLRKQSQVVIGRENWKPTFLQNLIIYCPS